ncbi:hypothetical protein [uncultured Bartonella sp.]|uniref:hypothetical protein n=1 Tax=uncultured Bartonella sp. TaxID=104108 RepID=UPI0026277885|nr:hypothetical protein [uncultured Bartonella sp.]
MIKFLNTDDTKQKIEKRIHDLKIELALLTKHKNWPNQSFDVGELAETVKDKGQHVFDVVGERAHYISEQSKKNPKTTLAIIGILGVAAYFLLRKK